MPAFSATVELVSDDGVESPATGIEIIPSAADHSRWSSAQDLTDRIDRVGYGTGPQLLAATVRTFIDVADSLEVARPEGFRLSYRSTIPRQVGLAGSSAIVVAALGCLCEFSGVEIPDHLLPSVALRVETEQLGIAAGLQDRVVQVYGGLVAMDFSHLEIDPRFGVSHGSYERLDPAGLPPLFLAYREDAAEPSGKYHGYLRARFDAGDVAVRGTMHALAALAAEGRAALHWGTGERIADLIADNMELRRGLGPMPAPQLALVDLAESLEAPATFTGSGGAVVGVHRDSAHFQQLRAAFESIGASVIDLSV